MAIASEKTVGFDQCRPDLIDYKRLNVKVCDYAIYVKFKMTGEMWSTYLIYIFNTSDIF